MKIARVFPRRTNASPCDGLSFFDAPGLFPPKVDEVHVSIAFTWDLERGFQLAREWDRIAPVKVGGPATGMRGEDFTPGMYLNHGHVITSRGCNNRCWFCSAWKREGKIRELPIRDGWIVTDDNWLGTSEDHKRKTFDSLMRQPCRPEFRGGLEARLLRHEDAVMLRSLKPRRLYFAYDTPGDYAPLCDAGLTLRAAGFTTASHTLSAYVLCGWPKSKHRKADTFLQAERRMRKTMDAGFVPFAMAYRDNDGKKQPGWSAFQKRWARPQIVFAREAPHAL